LLANNRSSIAVNISWPLPVNRHSANSVLPIIEGVTENGTNRTITRQHVAPTMVEAYEFMLPFG
jgi:hypothetical protein